MKKRTADAIYLDILMALEAGPVVPTRLARIVNVPYDRMVDYTSFLEGRGLLRKEVVDGQNVFRLLPDGYVLCQDWRKVQMKLRL
ncbi:MAG: hypothetical protein OK422_01615 [Thaumarchaeota archaeon]|nr:hypothetical protein [Nitrososphaerota archaeon]